jgi:hypothetical protein
MTGQELTEEARKLVEIAVDGHRARAALIVLMEDGAEGMAYVGDKHMTTPEEARKQTLRFLRHVLHTMEGN